MKFYNNVAKALSKKNVDLCVGDIYDYMAMWKQWYKGSVDDFHYYNVKLSDGKTVQKERLTMNMPKKVCEDITKLLWTEKTEINLSNKNSTKKLWEVLNSPENAFRVNFPFFIETTFALGNGALIEYKKEGKTIIDYVSGDVIIPYKYTNSYVNGLITISRFTEETSKGTTIYYTHITYHEFDGRKYIKLNELYKSKSEDTLGKEIDFSDKFPDIQNPYEVETPVPHFQLLQPVLANNLDIESPLGISFFANSIDRFKAIDTKYDDFMNEFDLGRKRILVDSSVVKPQVQSSENGKAEYVSYFDSADNVFMAISGMEQQPVKEIDFNLRAQAYIDSINAELSWLSSNLGLGSNFYKFDGVSVKTAKEVMSENSEAFRTKKHHQLLVDDVVTGLVQAICNLENIKTNSISIVSDDSIIEDKDTEQVRAMQEVSQGLMAKKTYLMKYKGLSEEEADEELQRIQDEKMTNQEAFGFPTENTTENSNKDDKEKEEKKSDKDNDKDKKAKQKENEKEEK